MQLGERMSDWGRRKTVQLGERMSDWGRRKTAQKVKNSLTNKELMNTIKKTKEEVKTNETTCNR